LLANRRQRDFAVSLNLLHARRKVASGSIMYPTLKHGLMVYHVALLKHDLTVYHVAHAETWRYVLSRSSRWNMALFSIM